MVFLKYQVGVLQGFTVKYTPAFLKRKKWKLMSFEDQGKPKCTAFPEFFMPLLVADPYFPYVIFLVK